MGYNPAERVVVNQIHLPDASESMSEEFPRRHGNRYLQAIKWDLKPNLLCEVGYWALSGQRE
jgi:hypothetical protein